MANGYSREDCPHCGNSQTEFVQFADGSETTTVTPEDEVVDGVLECRQCNHCGSAVENVLTVTQQRVYRGDE